MSTDPRCQNPECPVPENERPRGACRIPNFRNRKRGSTACTAFVPAEPAGQPTAEDCDRYRADVGLPLPAPKQGCSYGYVKTWDDKPGTICKNPLPCAEHPTDPRCVDGHDWTHDAPDQTGPHWYCRRCGRHQVDWSADRPTPEQGCEHEPELLHIKEVARSYGYAVLPADVVAQVRAFIRVAKDNAFGGGPPPKTADDNRRIYADALLALLPKP